MKVSCGQSKLKLKIYFFLKRMHMLEVARFILGLFRKVEKFAGISGKNTITDAQRIKEFHASFRRFMGEIEQKKESVLYQTIIFSGYISTFVKGGNLFFTRLLELCENTNLVTLSQSGKAVTDKEKDKLLFEPLTVPRVPFKGGYDVNLKIKLTDEMKQTIGERGFLRDAVENIKSYHDDMGDGYAEAIVYYTYQYTNILIKQFHPSIVIVHNKLYAMHDIITQTCCEQGVKTLYFEFGALPGTFALEDRGQMGASWVATDYEKLLALPVTAEEVDRADPVLSFLKDSGLNRNIQPKTTQLQQLKKHLKPGRPVILYAGQNDYDSGICPYNENSRQFHSPIFKSSDEAAEFLSSIADKYDWNLIYKPHPLPVKHGRCLAEGLPEKIIWVSDIDINEIIDISDVVITILSQCGEIALIRGKATLMLGFTQLRGKGCCYEAYTKEQIESVLVQAVQNGYTVEQSKCFRKYVALALKYYLFDDLNERPIRFGRGIEECAKYLKSFAVYQKEANVLAYCSNYFELAALTKIINRFGSTVRVDIFVSDCCKGMDLSGYNNIIRNIDEFTTKYDAYFVPSLNKKVLIIYENLINLNSDVEIHLYDNGKIKTYCMDIPRMLNENFKEFPEAIINKFQQNLSHIYLYRTGLMVWKNISAYYHPINFVEQEIVSNICLKEFENKFIDEQYIFIESDCFSKKINSNEMDLLEAASEAVGKENIVVKLFSKESRLRFQLRGYRAFYMSDDEWFWFRSSGKLRDHIILSLYPLELSVSQYMKDFNIRQIFLYKLFVGRFPFLNSRSFAMLIKRYTELLNNGERTVYIPDSIELLGSTIKYLGRFQKHV